MSLISHSQAGQELWVLSLREEPGTFLDVGCGQPVAGSNTALLEQLGWGGVLVDFNVEMVNRCRLARKGAVIHGDARTIDWTAELPIKHFNYLSLDVDEAQVDALKNLLKHGVRWDFATVETDWYRFGDGPRDSIRSLMTEAGYRIAVKDVAYGGNIFEDWWQR